MRRLAPLLLPIALLACGESGAPSAPPDLPRGRIEIAWEARTVDWGAPESLRADLVTAPAGAVIVWRSLDDFYLGAPVVLGSGPAITTAALKPGTTLVEAAIAVDGRGVASDSVRVSVAYRESWNMALEGQVAYPPGTVADVWVEGGHALLARRSAGGISIIALDGAPREVGRFTRPGLFTQDVKAAGGTAYVSHEGSAYPNAVTVVDVTDPADPLQIGAIPRGETPSAHNLWLDGPMLYVADPSMGSREIHAYDVGDPAAPRPLATLASTNGSAHDVHARGGLVFGSYLPLRPGEIGELVVASAAPGLATLTRETYGGAFTHSSWLSADGRYLYVADEVLNAPIRIFDVSNPAAPVLVSTYQPRVGTVPHNFQVRDERFAFLAHYKHGVEAFDVSDPLHPRLVGFYDTFPGAQADVAGGTGGKLSTAHEEEAAIFDGAWGVHWTSDGRIVVSDMASGLYVLRFTP